MAITGNDARPGRLRISASVVRPSMTGIRRSSRTASGFVFSKTSQGFPTVAGKLDAVMGLFEYAGYQLPIGLVIIRHQQGSRREVIEVHRSAWLGRGPPPAIRSETGTFANCKWNTVPWPTTLSTVRTPPIRSIMRLTMVKPMPLPSFSVVGRQSTCTNGLNTSSSLSAVSRCRCLQHQSSAFRCWRFSDFSRRPAA